MEITSFVFFAVFSFVMKAGVSVANLIFPSLLLLGKSTANSLGVQLAAWLALLSNSRGINFFSMGVPHRFYRCCRSGSSK